MKKSLLTVLTLPLIFSMVAFASPTTQDNQATGALHQKSIDPPSSPWKPSEG